MHTAAGCERPIRIDKSGVLVGVEAVGIHDGKNGAMQVGSFEC
jgi:hypothetical protein